MAVPAVMGGIGAGVNAISGIASSQQSKRAGKQAANQMQHQQDMLNNFLMGELNAEDGTRSGGLLQDSWGGMQDAIGGLGGLADANAQSMAGLANQAAGINPQYDFERLEGLGGHEVGGYYGDALAAGGGLNEIMAKFTSGSGPSYGTTTGPSYSQYNFDPGRQLMDQTMEQFATEEAGVRANVLDQMASQAAADMGGLDAALAGRGLGRGSGVATGALADLAGQQGQQMAGLNRDLATLGTQRALEGAQFDVGTQLQRDQMGSQYNLGMNQLRSQDFSTRAQQQNVINQLRSSDYSMQGTNLSNLLSSAVGMENVASSYNLGRDQTLANYDLGFQGMESQYGLDQSAFALQNLMSQGNLLNQGLAGQLEAGLGVGGLYGNMMGPAISALLESIGIQGQGVAAAGQGAGANPFGSSIMDFARNYKDWSSGG